MTVNNDEMTGQVVFEDGARGEVWPELLAVAGGASPSTRVRLEDGRQVVVPTGLLIEQADGSYAVPLRALDLPHPGERRSDEAVIPVAAETLDVRKREVETGRVRLTKTVQERTQTVDEALLRKTVTVSRVPVGRLVDAAPAVRYEGDTMIVSVLEEVLVVEKRLMLVEEVHVTQQQTDIHAPQQVTLRHEQVTVERLKAAPDE